MKHCKNCGNAVTGKFCSHCGQKTKVERITFSYLWHELFHFISHMEDGFFFTSLWMLKEPGKTVKDFVEGKRKKYQPPISYFIIWITIYILFLYFTEKTFGENAAINYKEYFGPGGTTKLAISHLGLVLMIVVPFQALYLYLLVTRKKYNFFESMVAAIYALGTIILLQFLFAVLAVIIHIISGASVDLGISDSLKILFLAWFIFHFVKLFPVKHKFLRAFLFVLLAFGTFTLWRLYGLPGLINMFLPKH